MIETSPGTDRSNRVLSMLSRINRTIVRADSPDGLYQEACRIAVESGLFSFAWISLVEPPAGRLKLMYQAGSGRCPAEALTAPGCFAETVCRSGQLAAYDSLDCMPESQGRSLLLGAGYGGIAGLPLIEDKTTIGVLCLHAERPGCFDALVMNLLDEVMDDLAFSLQHILNEQRRMANEAKLHYLAFYDAQTGMPNRALLEERLPHMAADADRRGARLTLLDIRLQRLDNIAQIHGRQSVDEVLRTLALRLEQCRGADGMLVQFSHDEFLLLTLDLAGEDAIEAFADVVKHTVEQPVSIGGTEAFLHAAIGGVMYRVHEQEVGHLVRRARAAGEHSERDGRFHVYDATHDEGLEQRLAIEAELHRALERGEFCLFYQPQLDLASGRMTGVEALLRWRHPVRGLVSPAHFIPLLEECGLMPSVGAWVLETACRQASEWRRAGLPPLRMAVNLSAQQFRDSGLVAQVRKALDDAGLEPAFLELELTESQILENAERTIDMMHGLKALGVSLSLDDFGTGYSSLSYLRRYPVDRIKIDQSFVRDMVAGSGNTALVRSIIAMAQHLGLRTVAEGVETGKQAAWLRKLKCHETQGFLFSRPVEPADILRLLASGARLAAEDHRQSGHIPVIVAGAGLHTALAAALAQEPMLPLFADDGASALELSARHGIGIIIAMHQLPDMAGEALLRQTKSLFPETECLLVAECMDRHSIATQMNSADLYKVLCKPVGEEQLRRHMREAARRCEMLSASRWT